MAAGLHGSARTTPRVRAELQASQEATRALATRYGLNPKTVAKWRRRRSTVDAPMGPSRPRSSVLTEAEEAIVVAFRRHTLLPLDDVLGCLRATIPTLSRSALHRCCAAARYLPPAEGREENLQAQAVCRDNDRLRPYRRLRAAPRPRESCSCSWAISRQQTADPSPARNRSSRTGRQPRVKVRPRRLLGRQHEGQRCRVPRRGRRRIPLPPAHRAHRQRHGLCRPDL